MKFIGISGPIASGKSTLATELHGIFNQLHLPTTVIPFASGVRYLAALEKDPQMENKALIFFTTLNDDAMPVTAQDAVALLRTAFEMYPSKAEGKNRRLLQFIGTELGRNMVGADVWIKNTKKLAGMAACDYVICDDMRFLNEQEFVDLSVRITISTPEEQQIYISRLDLLGADYSFNDHSSEQQLLSDIGVSIPIGFQPVDVLSLASYIITNYPVERD